MEEPKLVVWRKTAIQQASGVLRYYEEQGWVQAVENLYVAIEDALVKLSKYPTIGQPSKKVKGVRSRIVGDHYRIFYKASGNRMFILAFYDMRQDPKKFKY